MEIVEKLGQCEYTVESLEVAEDYAEKMEDVEETKRKEKVEKALVQAAEGYICMEMLGGGRNVPWKVIGGDIY